MINLESNVEDVFGPAPEKPSGWSQVNDLFEAIARARSDQDAVNRLAECVSVASALEKSAFSGAVEAAVRDFAEDGDAEWARAFFHSVVEYGEARMLAKALNGLLDYVTGKSAAPRLH